MALDLRRSKKKDLIASKLLRLLGQNQPGEPVRPPQGRQNEPPPRDVGGTEGDQGLEEEIKQEQDAWVHLDQPRPQVEEVGRWSMQQVVQQIIDNINFLHIWHASLYDRQEDIRQRLEETNPPLEQDDLSQLG